MKEIGKSSETYAAPHSSRPVRGARSATGPAGATAPVFTLCQQHVFKVLSYVDKPLSMIKINQFSKKILFATDHELDPSLLRQLRTRYGVREVSAELPRFYYEIVIPRPDGGKGASE